MSQSFLIKKAFLRPDYQVDCDSRLAKNRNRKLAFRLGEVAYIFNDDLIPAVERSTREW